MMRRPAGGEFCYTSLPMSRDHHLPLFHPRLVKDRRKTLDPSLFRSHQATIARWVDLLSRGTLDQLGETPLHGEFLRGVFGDILGYRSVMQADAGRFDLWAEVATGGGRADAALGIFSLPPDGSTRKAAKPTGTVIAPIELKGSAQFLEHAKGRSLTPVQQGWDYANKTKESRWIIVSNYRETRLYAKSHGQAAYELFWLKDLATEEGFLRFVALLGRDALLGGPSVEQSPLCQLLQASERTEREITERLYAKYRHLRERLFHDLCHRHSNIPAETLLGYAQTILDRVLFLAFAERRLLVPPNTLRNALSFRNPYAPSTPWQNLVAVFRSVDRGNTELDIPAYDGGLFRELPELADLEIPDELCAALCALSEYDFAEEVSVDVLGHVFEQSIADLEALRRDLEKPASADTPKLPSTGTQKAPGTRKQEGIFYTPPFVTSYLVRETLGRTFADAWDRSGAGDARKKDDRIAGWEAYRSQLRQIRVLDPSCGSGAFLIAAFDALAQEFARVNEALAELRGERGQVTMFDLTRAVLNENLFGIDKSMESAQITKLSLWLKTAERGKRLTFLDRNIRHGNSVVSEPQLDPWAFDWGQGQVVLRSLESDPAHGPEPEPEYKHDAATIAARWREGFDVVIGNPPYVRHELLTKYKDHFRANFEVFDGSADLFVYFFERGITQLKVGGRLGFIVSNKWLRGGYAEKLRTLLSQRCTLESIIDFGHAPIFPDADAFPCIVTLRKLPPAADHNVQVTLFPREELHKEKLATYVETHAFALPQSQLGPAGFTLEPTAVQDLLAKLRRAGPPLSEYARVRPHYGIKTGCNEAFLIDDATKQRLCQEDPRSIEVLKKYLRGQDIARWAPTWADQWIVLLKSSRDHRWPWSTAESEAAAEAIFEKTFPALHRHMKRHEARLRKRRDHGRYFWELRACAYYDLFEKPAVRYPDILWRSDFCVVDAGVYTNNTTYLLPTEDRWLLACLNAPILWWYHWRMAQHAKDEALRMFGEYIVSVPIAKPTPEQREKAEELVGALSRLAAENRDRTTLLLDMLRSEYDVDVPGPLLADFARLGSDGFVREVKRRRKKGGASFTLESLAKLRATFERECLPMLQRQAQQRDHERALAEQVHAAYGLTQDDLLLIRSTQTPRMPPGL